MSDRPRITFVNQSTGFLFIDVVNAFADDHPARLFAGIVDELNVSVRPSVERARLIPYRPAPAWRRIVTWGTFTLQFLWRALVMPARDELFIVSNPPFAPFVGLLVNRLRGIRYHLLIYDVYPDAIVRLGLMSTHNPFIRLWVRCNRALFAHASTIITLSDGMAALIRAYHPDVRVEVIQNWAHTELIKPVDKSENPFARAHGQVDRITVMYSGNMGATHAVEEIAVLADALREEPTFSFMAIGDGAKRRKIEAMRDDLGLQNLTILPYQPSDVLPFSIATADIGIVTLSAGAEALSVPSKTFNLLAAGVALLVIASPDSEIAHLVDRYDCGAHFEEHETERIVAFLRAMARDPDALRRRKANAHHASQFFTPQNAMAYRTVLHSNRSGTTR